MKAAVTVAPHHMEVRDVASPTLGPDQALIRVEAVGICGSDLHFYSGDHPYGTYPQTQGHEFAGIVEGFGGSYNGPVQIGERVAIEPLLSCGTCYPCRQGRPNCCMRLAVLGIHVPGGMAELFAVPTKTLYPIGDLAAELGAMIEPISIGVQATTRGQVTAEDRVVIFGAGPIGQAILLSCVDRGARVLVIDLIPARLELARLLGAEVVVQGDRETPAEIIAAWTEGDGAAVVFDAVGSPAIVRSAIDLVASAGRIVIVGLSQKEVAIPVIEFTRKELTVLGSRNNAGLFGEAVALVTRHQERVRALITHRYTLDQAPEAIKFALQHPTEAEKVMLLVQSGHQERARQ